MLEQSQWVGLSSIITFQPHGRSILIKNRDLFSTFILSQYFPEHKQIESFLRQLNIYGFLRMTKDGPDCGSYYHALFLQGRPDLCHLMQRSIKGTNSKRQKYNPDTEPDFYSMSPVQFPPYHQQHGTMVDNDMEHSDSNMVELQNRKLPPTATTKMHTAVATDVNAFQYPNWTLPPTAATDAIHSNVAPSVNVASLTPMLQSYQSQFDQTSSTEEFLSDTTLTAIEQQKIRTYISSSNCPIANYIFSSTKRPSKNSNRQSATFYPKNVAANDPSGNSSNMTSDSVTAATSTIGSCPFYPTTVDASISMFDASFCNKSVQTRNIPLVHQRNVADFTDHPSYQNIQQSQGTVPFGNFDTSPFNLATETNTTTARTLQWQDSDISNEGSTNTNISPFPFVERERQCQEDGNTGSISGDDKLASIHQTTFTTMTVPPNVALKHETHNNDRNRNASSTSSTPSSRTSGSGMTQFFEDVDMEDSVW